MEAYVISSGLIYTVDTFILELIYFIDLICELMQNKIEKQKLHFRYHATLFSERNKHNPDCTNIFNVTSYRYYCIRVH